MLVENFASSASVRTSVSSAARPTTEASTARPAAATASSSAPGCSGGNNRTGVRELLRQAASAAASPAATPSAIHRIEPDPASPEGNLARIEALVTPRTRVIQVSHITCTTGQVMPAREIAAFARSRGIWCHIDGAQSAGAIPLALSALGCDSYAFSGHKWLGGPHETGVLFLRRDRLEAVAPTGIGAYSGEVPQLPGQLKYFDAASRHEYGTRNAALAQGLAAAVQLQETIGRERIAAHGAALAAELHAACTGLEGITLLTPRPTAMRGAITTIRHARADAPRFFGYLMEKHRLRCRPVTEQDLGAVRISTHVFNSAAENERIVAAVRASPREL